MQLDAIDPNTLIVAGGILLAALLVVAALLWRGRGGDDLAGRLSQMAETQAANQAQLAQRLQAQERALTETLERKLADVGKRVGDSLNKTSIETHKTMADLRERLGRIDAAQKNIAELSSQMVGLQDILSNKQARGAFGEIQLRDLVSNVLPPSAYEFQATLGEGRRVDCLLKLPNPPGVIAIDAKFPLEPYHALRAAEDDIARARAKREFTAALVKHIMDIKERYIVPGETAESALMFLPSEAVYAELHANFPAVVERSFRERVFIVSPTTLWATLNTVRAVLKDVHMREQAGVIQKELRTLLRDVLRLDERVGKLQRHFDQATEDVRLIRTSTEKISTRAGRIDDLQLEEAAPDAVAEATTPIAAAPPAQSTRRAKRKAGAA